MTFLPLFFFATFLFAQTSKNPKQRYYQVAVSNSHSDRPFGSFSSLFYKNFHPGLDIGYGSVLKNKNNHQWLLEIHLSYMFHRWVQHNIALYGDVGYRHKITASWSAAMKVGTGYQHSIPDSKMFRITEEGIQEKKNLGRSQVIGNFGLSISKDLEPPFGAQIFMEYQQRIQAPFIKEYVPVLPYNNLLLGVTIPVHNLTSKK